jgi:hypothetical protein
MKELKKFVNKKHIFLVNRGNSAIKLSLKALKEFGFESVMIPDQGGWLTYRQYPKKLSFRVENIKTEHGLIKTNNLGGDVLLYQSLAGYFAEQDLDKIRNNFSGTIVLDICNLGERKNWPADILVGSFGRWKAVNLEYGGFIATDSDEIASKIDISGYEFNEKKKEQLKNKLDNLPERLDFLYSLAEKVKKDLSDFDIIHRNKKGFNVIVKFNNLQEKNKIIEYCNKQGYPYTLCPRYIRVKDDAVSIELKRLL